MVAMPPLPSPQCGEHAEPGGDQSRRQITAASSSSSFFSHLLTRFLVWCFLVSVSVGNAPASLLLWLKPMVSRIYTALVLQH